jgi:hypothetical protein
MTPSGNFRHSRAQSGPIFPSGVCRVYAERLNLIGRAQLIGQGLSE